MAQRNVHYESAFEHFLRRNRIPYIAVDEARKTLPAQSVQGTPPGTALAASTATKSFDFVVSAGGRRWLVDVKGRRLRLRAGRRRRVAVGCTTNKRQPLKLESWVTQADIDSLTRWRYVLGDGFEAVFVFVYWCSAQPPDSLLEDVFYHRNRWYAMKAVRLEQYRRFMSQRSPSWLTLHVPSNQFDRISRPVSRILAD